MITSLVAGEPNDHLCSECSIRQLGVCAALDKADLRELTHLSRRIQYSAGETVFAQEEMTTSFYKLLDDTALQAAARMVAGRSFGFALPGDFPGLAASK
jgi:CRP/FNR family transcriptional regulator, anaerobic regulatory protein